jgi:hypothetical protein
MPNDRDALAAAVGAERRTRAPEQALHASPICGPPGEPPGSGAWIRICGGGLGIRDGRVRAVGCSQWRTALTYLTVPIHPEEVYGSGMLVSSLDVTAEAFQQATGWEIKAEGACKGESVFPLPGATSMWRARPNGSAWPSSATLTSGCRRSAPRRSEAEPSTAQALAGTRGRRSLRTRKGQTFPESESEPVGVPTLSVTPRSQGRP